MSEQKSLSNLSPSLGSTRERRRKGRGQGSGYGGTSTRGHKGAKSRSGYSRKIGFEGGQMPLQRRLPKFGFKNPFRVEYLPINLDLLQRFAEANNLTSITPEILHQHGLIKKGARIKVLARGECKLPLAIQAHGFSKAAAEAIEKAQGSITLL